MPCVFFFFFTFLNVFFSFADKPNILNKIWKKKSFSRNFWQGYKFLGLFIQLSSTCLGYAKKALWQQYVISSHLLEENVYFPIETSRKTEKKTFLNEKFVTNGRLEFSKNHWLHNACSLSACIFVSNWNIT